MKVIRIVACMIVAIGLTACDIFDESNGGGGSSSQINSGNAEWVAANAMILVRLIEEAAINAREFDHPGVSCPGGASQTPNYPESGMMEVSYDFCDAQDLVWDGIIQLPMNHSANPYEVAFFNLDMIKTSDPGQKLHPFLTVGESILLQGELEYDRYSGAEVLWAPTLEISFSRHISSSTIAFNNYGLWKRKVTGVSAEYDFIGEIDSTIIPSLYYAEGSDVKMFEDQYPHTGEVAFTAKDDSGVKITINSENSITLVYFDIEQLRSGRIETTWQDLASFQDAAIFGLLEYYWLSFN